MKGIFHLKLLLLLFAKKGNQKQLRNLKEPFKFQFQRHPPQKCGPTSQS